VDGGMCWGRAHGCVTDLCWVVKLLGWVLYRGCCCYSMGTGVPVSLIGVEVRWWATVLGLGR